MVFTGRYSEAEGYLSSAEKILTPICDTSDPVSREQYGHVATVRVYLASRSQDASGIIRYAELAQKHVSADNVSIRSFISIFLGTGRCKSNQYELAHEAWKEAARLGKEAGNILIAVIGLVTLAELTRIQGKLHEAFKIFEEAARVALDEQGKPFPVAAEVYVGRARLHYEWNDLRAAEDDYLKASTIIKIYSNYDLTVEYGMGFSRLRLAQGDNATAEQLIQEIAQSDRQANYKAEAAFLAYQISYYLAKGDLAKVMQITCQQAWNPEEKNLFAWAEAFITYAKVLIFNKDINQAYRLLEECRARLESYGLWTPALRAMIIQAVLLEQQGKPLLALDLIQRALTLAEPEGYVRVFIDEGQPVKGLVSRARSSMAQHGNGSDSNLRLLNYIDRLLEAYPSEQAERSVAFPVKETSNPDLIDPQTE